MREERKPTLAEYSELWLSLVMRHLPVEWVSAIGGYLGARQGRKAIEKSRPWVDRLHRNFEHFSGVKNANERERCIVEYARQVGRTYAEITVLQRLVAEGRVEVIGLEHLENLSHPAIIASCHLANWELVGFIMTLLEGGTCCALYAPPNNPVHHRLAVQARTNWQELQKYNLVSASSKAILVPASSKAIRQITKSIALGHNLLMYIDEERDGYICSPSLGRTTPKSGNHWLTAKLAVRYNIDIIPVHVEVTGNARYRVIIEPKLTPGEGNEDIRTRTLADQMDRFLDRWIRARPEHWYWFSLYEQDKPAPDKGKAEPP